jgi:hypothetical protein
MCGWQRVAYISWQWQGDGGTIPKTAKQQGIIVFFLRQKKRIIVRHAALTDD